MYVYQFDMKGSLL